MQVLACMFKLKNKGLNRVKNKSKEEYLISIEKQNKMSFKI